MSVLWAILNGGQSTRFGSPKYLANSDGESFLEIATQRTTAASSIGDRFVLSGGPLLNSSWDVVTDSEKFVGPLAAVHAIVTMAAKEDHEVAVVQPIDMPLVQPDQLRSLRLQTSQMTGVVIAESQTSNDRHWVLAAVHRTWYADVINHIESGACRSLKNLWTACECKFLSFPDEYLVNINFPHQANS